MRTVLDASCRINVVIITSKKVHDMKHPRIQFSKEKKDTTTTSRNSHNLGIFIFYSQISILRISYKLTPNLNRVIYTIKIHFDIRQSIFLYLQSSTSPSKTYFSTFGHVKSNCRRLLATAALTWMCTCANGIDSSPHFLACHKLSTLITHKVC